jgi:LysM repeat protein
MGMSRMKTLRVGILICVVLSLAGAQTAWAGPPRSNPVVHIVQWGENLTNIAWRYGVTIQAIVQANGLYNANRIYAGQRLVIPGGGWAPQPQPVNRCSYVVRYGDTLSGIAYRYGVSVNSIVRANNLVNPNRIYTGQHLAIPCGTPAPPAPAPGGVYYVVCRGDTLAKIAYRFGVSVWSIVNANGIANPNVIYPGQRFYIPKGTPQPSPRPSNPGCEHLSWPTQGAVLSGVVGTWGTADHASFGYYKFEYRKDGLDDWHYITGQDKRVVNGPLGAWDTRGLSNGTYMFRLVIVDQTGNYPPPCEIVVHVRNP